MLLGFSCRNRLLLSGTPIQNSMAELWALLHFIMPSMFDSHNEFNEWFSKDIESHAENKTSIDESKIFRYVAIELTRFFGAWIVLNVRLSVSEHLTRLHLILKPFMLRRIKKDVENELSDKIEIMKYCPLTSRQKMLYAGESCIKNELHYSWQCGVGLIVVFYVALRKKIHIEDLLHSSNTSQSQAFTSNLMNLVMQFRKVRNKLFSQSSIRFTHFVIEFR